MLEQSTYFFLLEMAERTDKLSTLRLKAARTPADMEPANLPCKGCPVAQPPPARAQLTTGDLQPSNDDTTNNNINIWPPASQGPAAEPTQLLSLLTQSLGGPVVAYCLFLLRFSPRPSHDLYYTSHMLYICTYSP
jgi:hypothetical protein